jgi:hypothetical protein
VLQDDLAILRALEAEARRDPGHEDEHDHVESEAWRRYDAAWHGLIDVLDAPERWPEAMAVDESFGDVGYPGIGGAQMTWLEGKRTVRSMLSKAVERRLCERLARPEDDVIWSDPRNAELVKQLAIEPFPSPFARQFRVTQLAAWTERGYAVFRVRYEDESKELRVNLGLVALEGRRSLSPANLALVRVAPSAPFTVERPFTPGAVAEAKAGEVILRLPGPRWKQEKVAPGARLALQVRGVAPFFLAATAPAPEEPGVPHPDDFNPAAAHCALCGEEMEVAIGVCCVACEIGKVPRTRPLDPAQQEVHDALKRAWAETACPECGGRTFRWRLGGRSALQCVSCRRGWEVHNGSVRGLDVIERALAQREPGPGWTEVVQELVEAGDLSSDLATRWGRLVAPRDATPEWRETIRIVCGWLVSVESGALLFDRYDRDHHYQVVMPAAAKAKKLLEGM